MGACTWDWSRGDPDPPGECAPLGYDAQTCTCGNWPTYKPGPHHRERCPMYRAHYELRTADFAEDVSSEEKVNVPLCQNADQDSARV